MIWSKFADEVKVLLTVDAQRKGAGIQSYIDSVILSGIIELQQYIPTLRSLNRNTFTETLLKSSKLPELDGVQLGSLPGKGKITKATILKPTEDGVIAAELVRWPWEKRNSIAMGCLPGCRSPRSPGRIMQRAGTKEFHLYPSVDEDEVLVLDWEGVKTVYDNADLTPYDHRVVKVVSGYTKAHIVREVDKDLQLYADYYQAYLKERASLFLDEKDMSLFDMPMVTRDYYSTCCLPRTDVTPDKLPLAPDYLFLTTSPKSPFGLVYAGNIPNSPTSVTVVGAKKTVYHPYALANGDLDAQWCGSPTGLELTHMSAPTGLAYVIGVPATVTGLAFLLKPAAPRGLSKFVGIKPGRPLGLGLAGFVPSAPTGLASTPRRPTDLTAVQVGDLIDAAPTGLSVLAGPTGLTADLSNITGTIIAPQGPVDLVAVNDSPTGTWEPQAPEALAATAEGMVPGEPFDLRLTTVEYLFKHYVYNSVTGEFTLVSSTGLEVDPATGGSVEVNY